MCSYITLVVRGDAAAAAGVLLRHKRAATPIANPSVRQVLEKGETQFLTTVGHCDCGTALGAARSRKRDRPREAEKLRKKGWSQTKVDRAMEHQRKSDERPDARAVDDLVFWADLLRDVAATPGVAGAGVLVHFYSGDVETEQFSASRLEVGPEDNLQEELAQLQENELLVLRSGSGERQAPQPHAG
jgi:hypothetical protein